VRLSVQGRDRHIPFVVLSRVLQTQHSANETKDNLQCAHVCARTRVCMCVLTSLVIFLIAGCKDETFLLMRTFIVERYFHWARLGLKISQLKVRHT
jgi:hypothetical protein